MHRITSTLYQNAPLALVAIALSGCGHTSPPEKRKLERQAVSSIPFVPSECVRFQARLGESLGMPIEDARGVANSYVANLGSTTPNTASTVEFKHISQTSTQASETRNYLYDYKGLDRVFPDGERVHMTVQASAEGAVNVAGWVCNKTTIVRPGIVG